jgi:hypothetical protein
MGIRSVTFCNPEKLIFKNQNFDNFEEAAKLCKASNDAFSPG